MQAGILGGTRFIGWHLTQALLAAGYEVTLFHRGRTVEPRPFRGRVARVHGDRGRPETLAAFFEKRYDVVFDLSAYKLAQVEPLAARWRDRIGHFVFCSTASVYQVPPPLSFGEEARRTLEPGTYGGEKALAEDAVLAAGRRGWPVTVFRPQGVFGPHHEQQMQYVARRLWAREPVLLAPAFAGKRISFLWVEDLVAQFVSAVGREEAYGQAFNSASDVSHTPESLVTAMAEVVGAGPGEVVLLDGRLPALLPDLGLSWLDHDLVPDVSKATRLFGPTTPPAVALAKTWTHLRETGLGLKRQRWEKQAVAGRFPTAADRLSWRLYDAARLNPIARRLLG